MRQFFSWRAAILKSGLQPTTRHVLLTLACHMNDAGESCYPSLELLVEETGLTKRSIITHLNLAREAGWIEVEQHGFRGQKWRRNEYRIAWPNMDEGSERASPPLDGGGENNDTKVVNVVHHSTTENSSVNQGCHDQQVAAPDSLPRPAPILPDPVTWDGIRFTVDDAVYDQWVAAYSSGRTANDTEDWIEAELAKASTWLQANPRKRKKNLLRFITGWLTRSADGMRHRTYPQQRRPYH